MADSLSLLPPSDARRLAQRSNRQKRRRITSSKPANKPTKAKFDDDDDSQGEAAEDHAGAILGADDDEEGQGKTREELELEAALFGGSHASTSDLRVDRSSKQAATHVADDQLFQMDDSLPSPTARGKQRASDEDDDDASDSDSDDDSTSREAFASDSDEETQDVQPVRARKKALWNDPADQATTDAGEMVIPLNRSRLKKLKRARDETSIVGVQDYEQRLRQQYEKMHPTPAWATSARQTRATQQQDDLLSTTSAGILKRGKRLKKGEIRMTRLKDANFQSKAKSGIQALSFHPSASILFTASSDRRLKLFQIDGLQNTLLQSVHLPELPISSAAFDPTGNSILLTGNRPFWYSYDLQSGRAVRSPRGMWSHQAAGSEGGGMELFKFANSTPSSASSMLAVAGRSGMVHLIDYTSSFGAGGQVVGTVKTSSPVKGLAWQKQGKELIVLGSDAEVYIWDVGTRRCMARWKDAGGFGTTGLSTDPSERLLAIGSTSGIVNLYAREDIHQATSKHSATAALGFTEQAKAAKTFDQLTTSISAMTFNSSSELLAIASRQSDHALRLIHTDSRTVCSNWPTSQTPLAHVTGMSFRADSKLLAIGNTRGKTLLYQLDHYL
ncbi:uncharacterized protein L969DRAFT_95482 [Mixia osmundae IAM 14324]|uniref:Uncharacterized protein n=1 Tax=Mixia osmundae (strain CBS 9802 / IAM 14324 / JCM 22182 / KY 12970) TaxID=764103 RepID=G7E7J0_MIXOS|nr:uncharacterized protein L969DRAFT_95482 [Mixia osmundae IAM 14324]KEI38402.1 hypothetical protein L969DRAFT_95482 [Mixia osmundae IAM 14324]GAA98800.1 hypothetical protein E5Q_05488 [Mixia osmundae IAM 14324]